MDARIRDGGWSVTEILREFRGFRVALDASDMQDPLGDGLIALSSWSLVQLRRAYQQMQILL